MRKKSALSCFILGQLLSLVFLWAITGCFLLFPSSGSAETLNKPIFLTSTLLSAQDATPYLQEILSDQRQTVIELPLQKGEASKITLTAEGKSLVHHWVALGIRNDQDRAQSFVLSVPHQSLLGGRFFPTTLPGSHVQNFQISLNQSAYALPALGRDALLVRLEKGQTALCVIELKTPQIPEVTLWSKFSFDRDIALKTFFAGSVLGISAFLTVAILFLFFTHRRFVFMTTAFQGVFITLFLALEMGYGPILLKLLPPLFSLAILRTGAEAGMTIGLISILLAYLGIWRRSQLIFLCFCTIQGLCLALFAYSFFDAALPLSLIRVLFLCSVCGGFCLLIFYASLGMLRAIYTLPLWIAYSMWCLLAYSLASGFFVGYTANLTLHLGLLGVLVMMALQVGYFAFGKTSSAESVSYDLSRRALALMYSDHIVWDWFPQKHVLFVGPELEHFLGQTLGRLEGKKLALWLDLIHPIDRTAYLAALENAERRKRGAITHDFRLRRKDGSYRWYQLRARVTLEQEDLTLRMIGTLSDITFSKRSEERLVSDAIKDRITGLPNRALFIDRLERALSELDPSSPGRSLQVLVIDLDRFKNVNDGLGHEIGDSLLHITAQRLLSVLSPQDTLARLSGDQFGVIFENRSNTRHVVKCAETLKQVISQPIRIRSQEIFITASIGISGECFAKMPAHNALKTAEIALYEAKRKGKNAIEFFHSDISDERSYFFRLEQDLRRALERNQIDVLFQPIVRPESKTIAGFEALLRWRHASGDLIGPSLFIGIAEDTGMIHELGRYVLGESARQLGIWQRTLRPAEPFFVSVNLSSLQLLNVKLIEDLKVLLTREDIIPGTFKLELTETMIMQNPELSIKTLAKIKELGVGLSCDDFGTGYSTLSHLRRLPFDTLKIDRSFLEYDLEDERSLTVLEAIIFLAHDLNLEVVAEGVETEAQFNKLQELGCDFAQGYFVGEPLTPKQIMESFGGNFSEPSQKTFHKRAEDALDRFWHKRTPVAARGKQGLEEHPSSEADRQTSPFSSPQSSHFSPESAPLPQKPSPPSSSSTTEGEAPPKRPLYKKSFTPSEYFLPKPSSSPRQKATEEKEGDKKD